MRRDFPELSFSISCVGDICKGDEVLFNQARKKTGCCRSVV
jgi:hypothetical protein